MAVESKWQLIPISSVSEKILKVEGNVKLGGEVIEIGKYTWSTDVVLG